MYLYVFLNIYKVGFPGIKVWNILLNFTRVCGRDYLRLNTRIMCGFLSADYQPVRRPLCEVWV